MNAIAPNLTCLMGELVGARLIAHAGSLMTLAKYPASTVQILGAEKALFRALKTKHDTPKYGLIYHSSLMGQATQKNKGKIARLLATKASLSARVDALGEQAVDEDGNAVVSIGLENKSKIEARVRQLENKHLPTVISPKKDMQKFEFKESMNYNPSADATNKRKNEQESEKPKKKKKKSKE